jgi:hypothetical protein
MQFSPECEKAAQEPLEGTPQADLSDQQRDSAQQEQRAGCQSSDSRHVFRPFQGFVPVSKMKTAASTHGASRGSKCFLRELFVSLHLNLPDFRSLLSSRLREAVAAIHSSAQQLVLFHK